MQYGQIVFILFVAMACYYAFLIFTDIRKAQAAQNAEQENHTEEEIDISDEAKSFHPTKVSRDEEKKEEPAAQAAPSEDKDAEEVDARVRAAIVAAVAAYLAGENSSCEFKVKRIKRL